MNKQDLIQAIAKMLKQLATTGAFIGQEPYKSDLFKLFLAAANQDFDIDFGVSNMHADKLIEDLIVEGVSNTDKNLDLSWSMWEEWSYCYRKKSAGPSNDGKVVAHFVSLNDGRTFASVSEGYPATIRISLLGMKPLNTNPAVLEAPTHSFPLNAPIRSIFFYNGFFFEAD